MRKRKNFILKTAFLFVLIMSVCPLRAFAQSQEKVVNKGATGAVDISLDYAMDEPTESILPNQTVGLKSAVRNNAEPAWVRVKIQYPIYANEATLEHLAEENLTELNDELITFQTPDWEKIGTYYYLKRPVGYKETVGFTKSIRFPSDWDNRMVSSRFGISITAEAIQEKNFTPDFESEDPWLGAVIESFDATDYRLRGRGTDRFSVRFEDGAENMVRTGDDFFSNWDYVMPGDTLTGTADITNSMRRPVRLFFGIESQSGDGADKKLLKQLHLEVKHGEKVIYDGDLTGNLNEVLLEEYAPGTKNVLSYTLKAPASMDNAFAQKAFQSIWTFRSEIVPEPPAPQTPVERIIEIVKTGDAAFLLRASLCGLLLMASAGSGIYFIKARRRKQ